MARHSRWGGRSRAPSDPRDPQVDHNGIRVVPFQASTPVDPKVHLPDAERETRVETQGPITVTTYVDAPEPLSAEETILPEEEEEAEASPPTPEATAKADPWGTLNDLEGRKQ